ncbi:hypothetical protein D6D13_00684 [Aureobasidium pullulans]|uniref:Uncharacterized protein n=1 Tax=Aureobasidium pullulans TaxID=5580 RepID=A0A4S9DAG3_AURPU|nr:hypothetical protein D6D13_00684 [Aureobasidium pullulans]
MPDHTNLPEGDVPNSMLWPRAPASMVTKEDIILHQQEVLFKKLIALDTKAEERHQASQREQKKVNTLLGLVAAHLEIDPKSLASTKASTKSMKATRRPAAKAAVHSLRDAMKDDILMVSKAYVKEHPGTLLKTLTTKVKEEGLVTKWASWVEAHLQDEHRAEFRGFDEEKKGWAYKEAAKGVFPTTTTTTTATGIRGKGKRAAEDAESHDVSADEDHDETGSSGPAKRSRKTRANKTSILVDDDDEEESDDRQPQTSQDGEYEGNTLVDENEDEDHDENNS